MPVNAGPEYSEAERKYLAARTKVEKIRFLEEMIRKLPKHKGAEHVLAQLKKRLAKLKSESITKASSRQSFEFEKEGAATVCILGETQVGKSTLLKSLTNAHVKIGDHPFTTQKPALGMMFYEGVQIQMVEIPSTFDAEFMNIAHGSDLILVLAEDKAQEKRVQRVIEDNRLQNKNLLFLQDWSKAGDVKEKIWRGLGLIRIYTKSPMRPKDSVPVALKHGATIRDLAKNIHKDFLKKFKFARIFNNTRFSGQRAGLKYQLKDMDIVELHTD